MLTGKLFGVKCTECRQHNINFLDTYKIYNDAEEVVSIIFVRVFNAGNAQFSNSVEAQDNVFLYDPALQNIPPTEYFEKAADHPGKKNFTGAMFNTMADAEQESLTLLNDARLWLETRMGQPIEII